MESVMINFAPESLPSLGCENVRFYRGSPLKGVQISFPFDRVVYSRIKKSWCSFCCQRRCRLIHSRLYTEQFWWLVWLQSFFYFVARKVQLHSPPSVVSTIKHTVIASYRRPNIAFSIQICYIMKHRCCLTANALTRQIVVHSKRKKFLLYSYTIVLSCKVSSI